tara:strand:+ start:463 stop:681 length:219 start_codon:yes stop_codon:yes gene_type:complete
MKTMMNLDGTQIVRVSDEKAARLYSDGYKYIAKSIWKEKVRDVNKPTEEEKPTKKKSNKMSKSAKRHLRKSK